MILGNHMVVSIVELFIIYLSEYQVMKPFRFTGLVDSPRTLLLGVPFLVGLHYKISSQQ